MRSLFLTAMAVIAFCSTQFTTATAEDSGGGPKLPNVEVCGTLEQPNAPSNSSTLRPTHIRENSGQRRQYQLDQKSIDSVQQADHLVGDRVCVEGQRDGNIIRSAQVISEQQ